MTRKICEQCELEQNPWDLTIIKTIKLIKRFKMVTLEDAILTVNQLSIEQREMLLEIVKNQMIEARREEIAQDAKEAIAAFHRGELKPQPMGKSISELQATLAED